MRLSRFFLIVAVSAALLSAIAETGHAQTGTRGTAKVRPRFFNPFTVGPSRLALNPFGIFSVAQATNSSVPVTAPASAAAVSDDESGETLAVAAAVRPPFRPPVRSPFRPPPRPPF